MKNQNNESPYERFESMGPQSLTDDELLAIIIRTGTVGTSALELAHKITSMSSGNRSGILALNSIPLEELMKIKGIGRVKAIKLKCVAEICMRMQMRCQKEQLAFDNPSMIAEYYMEKLRHLETEHVYLLLTDTRNRFIKEILIAKGTVNESAVSTREIFIEALRYHAVHIILIHNHPSGDPTPSRQDIAMTNVLLEASRLMNIPLLDHIIIGDNRYTSLKEKGYL